MEKRQRAMFFDRHGERIRLVLIGGGAIAVATVIAKLILG